VVAGNITGYGVWHYFLIVAPNVMNMNMYVVEMNSIQKSIESMNVKFPTWM